MSFLAGMRMAALAAAVTTGLPGACAAAPDRAAAETEVARPLAPPLGWEILHAIRFAVFAGSEPDRYDVMIACQASGQLRLFYHRSPSAPRGLRMVLSSGKVEASFHPELREVRATPPPVGRPDGGRLEAIELATDLALESPVITEFLRSGRLAVAWGGSTLQLDAGPQDRAALAALWRGCT